MTTPLVIHMSVDELRALVDSAIDKALNTPRGDLTIEQAARELHVSRRTIDRLLERGKLEHVKVGRRVVVMRDSVTRLLEKRRKRGV